MARRIWPGHLFSLLISFFPLGPTAVLVTPPPHAPLLSVSGLGPSSACPWCLIALTHWILTQLQTLLPKRQDVSLIVRVLPLPPTPKPRLGAGCSQWCLTTAALVLPFPFSHPQHSVLPKSLSYPLSLPGRPLPTSSFPSHNFHSPFP